MHARVTLAVAAALLSSLPSAASARTLRLSPFGDAQAPLEPPADPAADDSSAVEALDLGEREVAPTEEIPALLEGHGAAPKSEVVVGSQVAVPPLLTDEAEIAAAQAQLKGQLLHLYTLKDGEPLRCCAKKDGVRDLHLGETRLKALLGPSPALEIFLTQRAVLDRVDRRRWGGPLLGLAAFVVPVGVGWMIVKGLTSGPCSGLQCTANGLGMILWGGVAVLVGGLAMVVVNWSHTWRTRQDYELAGVSGREELVISLRSQEAGLRGLVRAYNARLAAELGLPPPGEVPDLPPPRR